MKSKLLVLPIIVTIFLIGIVSAVTINTGTILNATGNGASMSFSFQVEVANFTVESTSIELVKVEYTIDGVDKYCEDLTHSTANTNLDSSEFGCASVTEIIGWNRTIIQILVGFLALAILSAALLPIGIYLKNNFSSVKPEEFVKGAIIVLITVILYVALMVHIVTEVL